MAGEAVGEGKGDPDELTSKPASARAQIFAAGAVINLLVAFPLAILACWVGRYVHTPQVSAPSLPEIEAGMRPGDTILEVDGVPIESRERYMTEIVRKWSGTEVPVKVRHADGREEILRVKQSGAENHQVMPCYARLEVKPDTLAWKAGLRDNDRVVQINGRPVWHIVELDLALREPVRPLPWSELAVMRPVTVTVERFDGRTGTERHTASIVAPLTAEWSFPADDRICEAVVGNVAKGSAAWGILEKGDVIRRVDGIEVRSWGDLREAVEPRGGRRVQVAYDRRGVRHEREMLIGFKPPDGRGALGIGRLPTKTVAHVPPGSPYEGILRTGDKVVSVGGVMGDEVSTETVLMAKVPKDKSEPPPLEIRVERSGSPLVLRAARRPVGDVEALGITPGGGASDFYRRWKAGEGVVDGLKEPVDMMGLTFQLLWKLVSGQESFKGFAGPVGIFQASYRSVERSHGNFFWILVLITVNLGIFNLLPVPVLDGGHLLLLAIEKARGRPNSVRFVEAFQLVGLVLLLGLIIVVTVIDIGRLRG
jgi:regulator of sigma E protease